MAYAPLTLSNVPCPKANPLLSNSRTSCFTYLPITNYNSPRSYTDKFGITKRGSLQYSRMREMISAYMRKL